jgi:hypothetical protein
MRRSKDQWRRFKDIRCADVRQYMQGLVLKSTLSASSISRIGDRPGSAEAWASLLRQRSGKRTREDENGAQGGHSQARQVRLKAEAPAFAGRFERIRPGRRLGIALAEPAPPSGSHRGNRDPHDHQQCSDHNKDHRKLPSSFDSQTFAD